MAADLVGDGRWILRCFFPRRTVTVAGTQEYRWGWLPAIIISVPYVIWAMNRSNFGDTETYRCIFYGAPSSVGQIASCLAEHAKDKGFSVFTILLKSIIGNSDKIFFLIIAAIQIFALCISLGNIHTIF